MSVRESGIQTRTENLIYFQYGKRAWVRVKHGTQYGKVGDPDVYGCVDGLAFGFEIKNEEGQLTKIQIYRLSELKAAGAVAAGISDPEDAVWHLKRALAPRGLKKTK